MSMSRDEAREEAYYAREDRSTGRCQCGEPDWPGSWAGNCDGCFLKGRAALSRMWQDHPERMQWWVEQEATPRGTGRGATFRADREDYATMARVMRDQGRLPFDLNEAALPCEDAACGV